MKKTIDLRECEKGDFLICSNGALLEYVRPCTEDEYLDHRVRYLFLPDVEVNDSCYGTRTHNGISFPNNPVPETDQDVIMMIKKKDAYKNLLKYFQSEYIFERVNH